MTSSAAPLIGLSGRRIPAGRVAGTPEIWATADVDLHFADYARCVNAAGGIPVQLSRSVTVEELIKHLDGLLLTGGSDIDPRRYGQWPDTRLGAVEPERDDFELTLLDEAARVGLPVLGVCRGAQIINVWRGGSLVQDIPEQGGGHAAYGYPRHHRGHAVEFVPTSRLAGMYGQSASVNSLHHQAVDRLGEGVVVAGRSPDGVVEAIELTDADIIGVQWHPEVLSPPEPVFAWLVNQAAAQTGTGWHRGPRPSEKPPTPDLPHEPKWSTPPAGDVTCTSPRGEAASPHDATPSYPPRASLRTFEGITIRPLRFSPPLSTNGSNS
jgi:putative glutamine amidotransferase